MQPTTHIQNHFEEHELLSVNNIENIYVENDRRDAKYDNGMRTEIQQFYKGQCVFITGGTGFLGKVLIEKLLRSCGDVDTIYVLIRSKKGNDPASRIHQMFDNILFKRVLEDNSNIIHKVQPIVGDLELPKLGISLEDRNTLIDKVTVIINMGATIKFDEKLSVATAINVRGTEGVLALAKECRNLKAFTHVSTAYSNTHVEHIEEKFYEPPMSVEVLNAITEIDEQLLENITPTLLGKHPNTYCFTKAIAEEAVRKYGEGMPISIVRPSIVVSTYEEPVYGWTDNMYGPAGIAIGAALGVLRALCLDVDKTADMVPVDLTVNAILASAWHTAQNFKRNPTSHIQIYNFVSGAQNPIKWRQFIKITTKYGVANPMTKAVWYYGLNPTNNYNLFLFYNFFLHYLPVLLIDTFSALTGKRRTTLKIYRRVMKLGSVLVYFMTHEWSFSDTGVQNMWKSLSEADRTKFPFDIRDMSWEILLARFVFGVRVYLLKDELSTLPEARKKWNRLFYLHQILKLTTLVLVLNISYLILRPIINTLLTHITL